MIVRIPKKKKTFPSKFDRKAVSDYHQPLDFSLFRLVSVKVLEAWLKQVEDSPLHVLRSMCARKGLLVNFLKVFSFPVRWKDLKYDFFKPFHEIQEPDVTEDLYQLKRKDIQFVLCELNCFID